MDISSHNHAGASTLCVLSKPSTFVMWRNRATVSKQVISRDWFARISKVNRPHRTILKPFRRIVGIKVPIFVFHDACRRYGDEDESRTCQIWKNFRQPRKPTAAFGLPKGRFVAGCQKCRRIGHGIGRWLFCFPCDGLIMKTIPIDSNIKWFQLSHCYYV